MAGRVIFHIYHCIVSLDEVLIYTSLCSLYDMCILYVSFICVNFIYKGPVIICPLRHSLAGIWLINILRGTCADFLIFRTIHVRVADRILILLFVFFR